MDVTNQQNKEGSLYQCQIDITFPTPQHALQAKEVLQVDRDVDGQIKKSFRVKTTCTSNGNEGDRTSSGIKFGGISTAGEDGKLETEKKVLSM